MEPLVRDTESLLILSWLLKDWGWVHEFLVMERLGMLYISLHFHVCQQLQLRTLLTTQELIPLDLNVMFGKLVG